MQDSKEIRSYVVIINTGTLEYLFVYLPADFNNI